MTGLDRTLRSLARAVCSMDDIIGKDDLKVLIATVPWNVGMDCSMSFAIDVGQSVGSKYIIFIRIALDLHIQDDN